MLKNTWITGAVFAGLLVASAAARADSRVFFVAPKDGATVTSPVHIVFGVEGMTVAPAGTITEGTGHHHLIIDGGPVPQGTVVPADETHIHYGKGQTETDVTLPPGDHTLTMQFADGAHRSYGPQMSQTITVHVK
ncbi:DUF4399 domain-containing protein [Trinickia violacea]|uniref:DUF4399 domain-containing protein n=1 Tax=Trinickia violacea TaxID=2571746 RepID=A0A4P8ILL3_9BURK|nr:DUF4399 domain-containing protein [Trinickia violacea]QCP48657.1 DUF4399 domain-containing protein [Trinickia violacea]